LTDNYPGTTRATDWLADLIELAGEARVSTKPAELAAHTVDGLRPWALVRPGTAAEVGQVLAWASARGLAVTPFGGGTKQGLGQPLTRLDLVVETTGLARVLEVDQGNLTATVEAGVTNGALQADLLPRRLRLALDPLEGDSATLVASSRPTPAARAACCTAPPATRCSDSRWRWPTVACCERAARP